MSEVQKKVTCKPWQLLYATTARAAHPAARRWAAAGQSQRRDHPESHSNERLQGGQDVCDQPAAVPPMRSRRSTNPDLIRDEPEGRRPPKGEGEPLAAGHRDATRELFKRRPRREGTPASAPLPSARARRRGRRSSAVQDASRRTEAGAPRVSEAAAVEDQVRKGEPISTAARQAGTTWRRPP